MLIGVGLRRIKKRQQISERSIYVMRGCKIKKYKASESVGVMI